MKKTWQKLVLGIAVTTLGLPQAHANSRKVASQNFKLNMDMPWYTCVAVLTALDPAGGSPNAVQERDHIVESGRDEDDVILSLNTQAQTWLLTHTADHNSQSHIFCSMQTLRQVTPKTTAKRSSDDSQRLAVSRALGTR